MNCNVTTYICNPATTTLLVTATSYLTKFATSKYNPFTATLRATGLVALMADLTATATKQYFAPQGYLAYAYEAAAITLGTLAACILNNKVLIKYAPSFGLISRNGAIAIGVAVLVARLVIENAKPVAAYFKAEANNNGPSRVSIDERKKAFETSTV
jgi:hypothetical protein